MLRPIICEPHDWDAAQAAILAILERCEFADGYRPWPGAFNLELSDEAGREFANFLSLVWAAMDRGGVVVQRKGVGE